MCKKTKLLISIFHQEKLESQQKETNLKDSFFFVTLLSKKKKKMERRESSNIKKDSIFADYHKARKKSFWTE